MMTLFKHKGNRIAIRVAGISFLFGTFLMLMALMVENELIITIGITFIVLYIPVTLLVLFMLFINTIINLKDIYEHTMAFIIVVMNFPVALVYAYFLNF